MRRPVIYFLAIFIALSAAVIVQADQSAIDKEQEDFLLSSLVGSYQVIGRLPESRKLYSGEIKIRRTGDRLNRLILERLINGVKIKCEATIESATADDVPVLRTAWKQGNVNYGATYLVHTDLDNFPRMTAYIYYSDRKTIKPGIEAVFIKESELR